jgi:ferredoxin-2, mitochondrial
MLVLIVFRLFVTFIDKEGVEHTYAVSKGDNLLDIALDNNLDMEGKSFCYTKCSKDRCLR